MEKKGVLFVDDEQNILDGLKRMFRPMRHEWEMHFANSGKDALEIVANPEISIDLVVTDMRMPEMDGTQLLSKIQETNPNIIRFVLSGHSEMDLILKSVLPTHQYLSKPCDPELLKAVVRRAFDLRELIADDSVKKLVSMVDKLPALPDSYNKIMQEIQSEQSSLEAIGRIIAQDVGMSAKILKMVNSSFFGFARHISSPEQAVTLLGLNIVKALILSAQIFSADEPKQLSGFSFEAISNHCIGVGTLSKNITENETENKEKADEAFIAGLLHDIGKIVLATNFTEEYKQVLAKASESHCELYKAEHEVLGTSHAEVGAYLMGLWGLPDSIVDAIARHHEPYAHDASFSILAAVHTANIFEQEGRESKQGVLHSQMNEKYLKLLGLLDKVDEWRALVKSDEG